MVIYRNPLYYEIAFSFIDAKKQADFFEKIVKKYSKRKVKTFLDIAAGPSLQSRELAKRGYNCIALDLSSEMLNYIEQKAKEEKIRIKTVKADMNKFKMKDKTDFAFIMMGSLSYLNNDGFLNHLDSVASVLSKGGLYFIENYRLDWSPKVLFKKSTWTMRRGKIKVRATYKIDLVDALTQVLKEKIRLRIDDNGKKVVLEDNTKSKQIFPEEFKLLIEKNGKFEFLGFFEHFKMKRLKKANPMNFILLRRK